MGRIWPPLTTAERAQALANLLAKIPAPQRMARLALCEQRVRQLRRVDLLAGIREYRKRLANGS
jgi:hypothetical protein